MSTFGNPFLVSSIHVRTSSILFCSDSYKNVFEDTRVWSYSIIALCTKIWYFLEKRKEEVQETDTNWKVKILCSYISSIRFQFQNWKRWDWQRIRTVYYLFLLSCNLKCVCRTKRCITVQGMSCPFNGFSINLDNLQLSKDLFTIINNKSPVIHRFAYIY